ncbi:MAG: DUF3455 domain-containing protein [Burkholderiaceae bacterium]
MRVRLILTIAAVAAVSACAGTGPSMAPYSQAGLPAAVQVPAGHTVAMQTMAAGDITWQCRAKADGAGPFEWAFAGPDAALRNRSGAMVGKYYGPPATWESIDGSRITGTQLAVAPAGSGNIPLQLVKADPAMGMGAMQGVSHVQRVNTRGGVAPAAPCGAANLGAKQVVQYTADYVFWRVAM